MPDLLTFTPLFPEESEAAILQRWIEWANEGLAEDDPQRIDTREGSMWRTINTPVVQEFARLYDLAGAEVPASANPLTAWSSYLDIIAQDFGIEREQPTVAKGRVKFSGPAGAEILAGLRLESTGTSGTEPVLFEVTAADTIGVSGEMELPIEAVEGGEEGNVAANAITTATTALPTGVTLTNPEATTGGTNVETDEHLATRVQELFEGRSAGDQLDYVIQTRKWLKENYTAKAPRGGVVSCIPVWAGAGTVKVIAMDDEGQPLEGSAVTALQEWWDPGKTGRGEGQAPVSAVVTVETGTVLDITVVATVTLHPGYSLTGFGGTIAVQPLIEDALNRYFLGVNGGEDVIFSQVEGAIVTVEGVKDISGLTVNTHTGNFSLKSEPPEVPRLTKLELTE
jgi:uncharacterized phage protein gp47/JayE